MSGLDELELAWSRIDQSALLRMIAEDLGWTGWRPDGAKDYLRGPCPRQAGKCRGGHRDGYTGPRTDGRPPFVACTHRHSCGFGQSMFKLLAERLGNKGAARLVKERAGITRPLFTLPAGPPTWAWLGTASVTRAQPRAVRWPSLGRLEPAGPARATWPSTAAPTRPATLAALWPGCAPVSLPTTASAATLGEPTAGPSVEHPLGAYEQGWRPSSFRPCRLCSASVGMLAPGGEPACYPDCASLAAARAERATAHGNGPTTNAGERFFAAQAQGPRGTGGEA